MITLGHPTGNAFVRHTLQALHLQGYLQRFYTTLATPAPAPYLPAAFTRRSYPIPAHLIRTHPLRELVRLACGRHTPTWATIDSVYNHLDRSLASDLPQLSQEGLSALYAYEDCAYHTFTAAQATLPHIRRIYDLPIGHYQRAQEIFIQEAALQPAWASTLGGLHDSPAKLARKAQELQLADHIIVASRFTASTLAGHIRPDQPVSIIPYGCPSDRPPPAPRLTGGPLRLLYVGSLTQRKGLSYLFNAVAPFAHQVQLTVVGRTPSTACPALSAALRPHRYIPSLPHADILQLMSHHDILLFPSLFEGFGLVLTEALAGGLPIIATPHTAAPDLITHGTQGFIVPIRDSAAIQEHIAWALSHRAQLGDMQQAAWRLSQTMGWPHYQTSIINTLAPYACPCPQHPR